MSTSAYYNESVVAALVPAGFGTGFDVGFVARFWRLHLVAGAGPVEYSWDGSTVHGSLGPLGDRPITVEEHHAASRIWLKASGETVSISAQG